MDLTNWITDIRNWLTTHGLSFFLELFLIILATIILIKVINWLMGRLFASVIKGRKKADEEFKKRTETLNSITRHVSNISLFIIATIIILGRFGIDIGPILAAAGVLGLAIGFGAQSLVKDIISGFFIFLEDQIRVGDVVEVAGKSGIVERLNLKMTILRDLSGNVHYVPNGEISVVTNMTKVYSRYVFDIGVAYREDVDEVIDVMKAVDEGMRNDPDYQSDILEPLEILGLDQFGDSALIIKARTKTKPIKQWRVAREFNRRLKKEFDARDIEIPFPHQTLYIGKDKKNQSPPLNIKIENDRGERS